ncbi:MAG: DUF2243 domain-containing protein [Betaproteobacteria bacterium]|nr:DUF2243 domain-containing protein [Betaproteobacteria bacterium]
MINTRIRTGALLLGIGLGAMLDAIVFRDLLQWNSMLSATLVPDSLDAWRVSLAADGLFRAVAWALALAGVVSLWSAFGRPGSLPSSRVFTGYFLLGWGWYNLLEGLVVHEFLALHHVRDLPARVPSYDWTYLIIGGLGFIAVGLALSRRPVPRRMADRRAGYERRGTGAAGT